MINNNTNGAIGHLFFLTIVFGLGGVVGGVVGTVFNDSELSDGVSGKSMIIDKLLFSIIIFCWNDTIVFTFN